MNKYPIGIQDFDKIREEDYLYIDKTQIIHKLIVSGNYYFLSRPRRFGKSLLLSTISAIFSGKKELFKGLWIHDQWNWEQKHPVIHLRFSQIAYQVLGLNEAISRELDRIAEELEVQLYEDNIILKFRELIKKAAVNERVVILIDEYDKAITDYLDNQEKAEENRSIFKSFYSVLKDADPYIRLLLITGVSRFTKVSIFSDLNNLNDITIHRNYATITGITQDELEHNFSAEITETQQQQPDFLAKLKLWYNGYAWHQDMERVYNPFSVLKYMDGRDFRNYWFATGSPTFLIKGIKAKGEYDFENVSSNENKLSDFDPANMLSIPLLFQTGYLTIKSYNDTTRNYTLGYPNLEVKNSLLDNLLSVYRGVFPDTSSEETGNLLLALNANDVPSIINALNAVIGSIPYDHWRADTESIFHIITLLTFQKIGVDVQTEVHNSKGRCDILVKTDRYIYVIELKRDGTAQEALDQILSINYLQPYAADKRKKIALGISFSSENRIVAEYLSKEVIEA